MITRQPLHLVASLLTCILACDVPAQRTVAPPCAPPLAAASVVSVTPGNYALTLVTTNGLHQGAQAVGSLWLATTSPSDRSPTTGHRPAPSHRRGEPYYGAANFDFPSVGAPVFRDDTLVPLPESRDPVRPGVVGLLANWQSDSLPRTLLLVIGSLENRRDDEGWEDGPGIGLWLRTASGKDFSGTWSRFGIVSGGEGYFCAQFVGP